MSRDLGSSAMGSAPDTLLCDSGERHRRTYYDDDWVSQQGSDLRPCRDVVAGFLAGGVWSAAASAGPEVCR